VTTRLQVAPVLEAALEVLALGFWPIAIYPAGETIKTRGGDKIATGKEPIGRDWGLIRRDEPWLSSAFRSYAGAGVGICFGPGRAPGGEWFADLEGDGERAADSLFMLMGHAVPTTMGWLSTRGGHNGFTVDGDRLLTLLAAAGAKEEKGLGKAGVWKLAELPDLEWRIGGHKLGGTVKQVQSVIPPTPGTDGKPREWKNPPSVGAVALPEAAYLFLEALAESKRPAVDAVRAASNGTATTGRNGHSKGLPFADLPGGMSVEDRAIRYLEKIDPAIEGQGGSCPTFRAACVMVRFGLSADVALRLLMDHYNPKCQPTWTEAEMRHKVEGAYESEQAPGSMVDGPGKQSSWRRTSATAGGSAQAYDKRPAVELNTERHIVAGKTLKTITGDPDLFRRGDSLGTVVEEQAYSIKLAGGVELKRARGVSRFLPLSEAALGCILTRNARFFCWKKDAAGESVTADCHPPNWLISAVATWGSWPGIRSLLGIASSPWVRTDGSIPDPGFDPATGTLYRPSVKLATMPDQPTKKDAVDAAGRLFSLVNDFPFASAGVDCSVWLAGLLTAIQRPAIAGPVPGFVFSGNKAGTGKGLLVDLIGLISGGIGIPTRTYPSDPSEAGKIKLSLALSGIGAVHFDNLPEGGFYGNSELDSALTSTIVEDRILGQSRESGPVPLRPVWFLTGNNISPGKDAFRRWIPCNLQTDMENPHERDDVKEKDLRRYVEEHRAELLWDALVILKSHAIAGRPPCAAAPLGSFEEWDALVRGAVFFAIGNDCLTNQRKAATDSPERAEKLALLEAWNNLPRGGNSGAGVTASEARTLAEEIPDTASKAGIPTQYPALREALLNLSRDSKLPSNRSIGNKLRAMNGQNIGGFKFMSVGASHQAALWIACKL
jgi:hypothetical protein